MVAIVVLVLVVLLVVAVVVSGRIRAGSGSSGPQTPGPTVTHTVTPLPTPMVPEEGWAVYFNRPGSSDFKDLSQVLVRLVERARQTVDLAAYDFDLENVAQALIALHRQGVQVRVVTDSDNMDEAGARLVRKASIPVVEDGRTALMHDKFVVVDGQVVLTGSWNFTENGTYKNDNNTLVITSTLLASNYTTEFEEMFLQHHFGPTSPANTPHQTLTVAGVSLENYFAPEDGVRLQVLAELADAQESIYFLVFSFTDDAIGEAMVQRAANGVEVRGVFEGRNATSSQSEYRRLRRAGLDVRKDSNPAIMHHKVMVVDERTVITGSFNFSVSAEQENDENVVIVHDPRVAALYVEEFWRIYNDAVP